MMSTNYLFYVEQIQSNSDRRVLSIKYLVPTEYLRPDITALGISVCVPRGLKNPLCFSLHSRFAAIREQASVARFRLSAMAGLANDHAARVESGSIFPSIETVERYAAALGVSPGWLAYGYEGSEPFRERYPRPIFEPADPTPDDKHRVFRALHEGFPVRLQQSRERSGLSMRTLSTAAGVSVQAWSNAEAGKVVPRVDTAERMAVALGVAPSWLGFGEGLGPN